MISYNLITTQMEHLITLTVDQMGDILIRYVSMPWRGV